MIVAAAPSPVLGEPIAFTVSVPEGGGPFPAIYLLHGRGASMDGWESARTKGG